MKAPFAGLLAGLACCILSSTAIGEAPSFKILKLDGNAVQWRGTVAKKMVTYALVEQDTTFERARNCRKMTRLDGLMSASKIAPETVRAEITAAFAMWETVANIRFREAASPEQADILIGAQLAESLLVAVAHDLAGAVQLYGKRGPEAVVAQSDAPEASVRRISPARLYAKRWGTRAFKAD